MLIRESKESAAKKRESRKLVKEMKIERGYRKNCKRKKISASEERKVKKRY